MDKMTVVWDAPAKLSFKKQVMRIAEDSIQNADRVRLDILSIVERIPENQGKFPPDRFKNDNDGFFRAFEKHSLRIACYISSDQIRNLRVRHIKQEPKEY